MPLALQEVHSLEFLKDYTGNSPRRLCPHIQAKLLEIPEDALLGARNPDSYTKVRMHLSDLGNAAIGDNQKFMESNDFQIRFHKLRKD